MFKRQVFCYVYAACLYIIEHSGKAIQWALAISLLLSNTTARSDNSNWFSHDYGWQNKTGLEIGVTDIESYPFTTTSTAGNGYIMQVHTNTCEIL